MTMKADLYAELGKRWLTALDALQRCGCLSLSQRCGDFRRDGATIIDEWVKLTNGKRIKRYRRTKAARFSA